MGGNTKRMSAEEKRKVVLDLYHRSKTVYTEKEILSAAAKAGVNANTVEAINQSLVDDGLVDKEKIGGSNYFWSFPAKKDRLMELQHQKAIEHIETLKKTITETKAALMDAKRGREETDPDVDGPSTAMDDTAKEEGQEEEGASPTDPSPAMPTRATKLARLAEIAKEKAACEKELEALRENDPQVLADLEKELHLVHQGANRWTDNIFICKDYLTKKRGMDSKQACKILEINSEFDYPEDNAPSLKKK